MVLMAVVTTMSGVGVVACAMSVAGMATVPRMVGAGRRAAVVVDVFTVIGPALARCVSVTVVVLVSAALVVHTSLVPT